MPQTDDIAVYVNEIDTHCPFNKGIHHVKGQL